jgi:hypothetical protein
MYIGIRRDATNGAMIMETSLDGVNWIQHLNGVYTAISTADLYMVSSIVSGHVLSYPKITIGPVIGSSIVFDVLNNLNNTGGVWTDSGSGGSGYRSVPFRPNSKFRIYFQYTGSATVITFGLKTIAAASDYTSMNLGWVSSGGDIYPVSGGALMTAQGSVVGRWYAILVDNGVAKAQISADGIVWTDVVGAMITYNQDLFPMVYMNASGVITFPKYDLL